MASEDGISKLPDDILICILSRLTIKEAAKTSNLASRWRYLWTCFSGCLDFNDLVYMKSFGPLGDGRDPRSLRCIDQVLGSLKVKDQSLEELRICLDIDPNCDVDSWLKFAIQKRVQRLDLQLRLCKSEWYNFPSHFVSRSLTSLRLASVYLNKEGLENLLCHCPFLEVLTLEKIRILTSIRVSGLSLKLNYLQLDSLVKLKDHLEVDVSNLISFEETRFGLSTTCFEPVPILADEMLREGCFSLSFVPDDVFGRLRTLKLEIRNMPEAVFYSIPELPNLKHLDISFHIYTYGFFPCVAFLKACPSLYKLTVQSTRSISPYERKVKKHSPHLTLRVAELVGFFWLRDDVKFLFDLLENATLLEKIIIDPGRAYLLGKPGEKFYRKNSWEYKSARMRAIELAAKFPHLEFVIP
ncbi:hypothetical protein WN944_024541 [Citrus x changshan-huyou]|uniref:F-box domain-containing protein n=1 Tax=Citrus x changshan-huyou TaxID=2935761 RepID=A0AAP0LN60_9ROSI